ncbi:ArsR/SmtB family transcription factor [Clostridium frigidicarnis]|uniref:DNA-binding transcriptional regulator, ArsR family n=1 Tax=Clostridium frigidicarnis TaxID=84698 RepID=A0A1I0Z242_9CLOT|nr:metalloregulator ArsR/SmtB family transcription factor [Clostridium frigidicarnis]SFB18690.1 DNA-binding transcriptional regulator, ArsR family [Clostridium frigidicarnis]
MNFKINYNVDYLYESLNVLTSIADNKSPSKFSKDFAEKYNIPSEELNLLFYEICDIFSYIESNISITEKDLNYLFKNNFPIENNFARIILNPYMSLDFGDILDKFKSSSYEERHMELTLSIVSSILYDEFITHEDIVHINNAEALFKYVQEKDISIELKYELMYLYYNYDELLEKVINILSNVIRLIKEKEPYLKNRLVKFMNFIEENLNNYGVDFLKSNCNITLNQNSSLDVYPSIFNSNAIYVSGVSDTKDTLILGINFLDLSYLLKKYKCNDKHLLSVLKALSDKSKLQILVALKNDTLYAGQLANKLQITNATISHHMSTLLTLNLVHVEKNNTKVYYSIRKDKISQYIDNLRDLLL